MSLPSLIALGASPSAPVYRMTGHLTPVDSPTESSLAKAEFTYRITDHDLRTPDAWVVGWSQNGTGGVNRGESGCFIADENPTSPGKPWRQAYRPALADYTCTIEFAGPVNGDRDHYSATFTAGVR